MSKPRSGQVAFKDQSDDDESLSPPPPQSATTATTRPSSGATEAPPSGMPLLQLPEENDEEPAAPTFVKNSKKKNNSNSNNRGRVKSLACGNRRSSSIFAPAVGNGERDLYIELEEFYSKDETATPYIEMMSYEWKTLARWIKYEQVIDDETQVWSKPFVGALAYANLIYIRNALQYATVILSADTAAIATPQTLLLQAASTATPATPTPPNSDSAATFESMCDQIVHDMSARGQVSRENRERFKSILLSRKRNHASVAASLSDRRAPHSAYLRRVSRANAANLMMARNSTLGVTTTTEMDALGVSGGDSSNANGIALKKPSIVINQHRSLSTVLHMNRLNSTTVNVDADADVDGDESNINNRLNVKRPSHLFHRSKKRLMSGSIFKSETCVASPEITTFLIMTGVVNCLERPGRTQQNTTTNNLISIYF